MDSRSRALGDAQARKRDDHAHLGVAGLLDLMAVTSRPDKPSIGLLLAKAVLDEAVTSGTKQSMGNFLFRFGAHLKASVSQPNLKASERLALASAAEAAFLALPTASTSQREECRAMTARLSVSAQQSDTSWRATLGTSRADFDRRLEVISRDLEKPVPSIPTSRAQTFERRSHPTPQARPTIHPTPPWLTVDVPGSLDSPVSVTANWTREDGSEPEASSQTPIDLRQAWSLFKEGDYASARLELLDLLRNVGVTWGPTSSADSLRSWHWLRLVSEMARVQLSETSDKRRSLISASQLALRCVPDDGDFLDDILAGALDDFTAGDPASVRAWCAYTARAVYAGGHEQALAGYSNAEKALLRDAWGDHFSIPSGERRNTAEMATTITAGLKEATQRLYVTARDGLDAGRSLGDVAYRLDPYLDEAEAGLFREAVELAQDVGRQMDTDSLNHRDLQLSIAAFRGLEQAMALSGSALLQDYVAPHIRNLTSRARAVTNRLGDISRPNVALRLASAKIPFSAAAGSTYQISFKATNSGNAIAEDIILRVTESDQGIDSTARLDALGPGAEAVINVAVQANDQRYKAPGVVVLTCELAWSDSMLQPFHAITQVSAEDQMAVAWTSEDVNPYSLNTISEPERLIGRDADLDSLDALIAGGASAYITGHKRVGKTSLTKVLLKSLRRRRGWAGSLLPLGRALTQEQGAGDLVCALLDEVLVAATDVYTEAVSGMSEVEIDASGNYARAANKWIRALARRLPEGARVIVAIDDFDEIPPHLVEGPQADALFLFLRSLVDEGWLNLIVVGSEILPAIIQAQAHKLNQVTPVSVTHFSTRESTAALLETPTTDRLEWESAAVDRMHYLCTGNPYYETLLAQRLWQFMRDNSRSIVTATDVDEAAVRVAGDASESHFIHLWADGTAGLDHSSRSAVVASAVVRAVARCGGLELAAAATDDVIRIAGTWIPSATVAELQQAVATLTSRSILIPGKSQGSLLLAIPLVSIWLNDAGSRALDGMYAASKHATATTRMFTDTELVKLSRELVYQGEHVSEMRMRAWLQQFGDNYHQYLAFRMLSRMVTEGFFTSTRLQTTILPRLVSNVNRLRASRQLTREANNQYLKNAYLINHGVPGDSTQGTLSALAKAMKIKKANIVAIDDLNDKVRSIGHGVVIFLLDDFCGSGTHLNRTLASLLEKLQHFDRESAEGIHVVVGAAVMANEESISLDDRSPFDIEVVSGLTLNDRFRPLSSRSGVFDSEEERIDASNMLTSIGQALQPRDPLGFGGEALLTLMEFNCPNNVAPVFWKGGLVSSEVWMPLFERSY